MGTAMYNIPETFGKALSYEGQIHVLKDAICDISDRIDVIETESGSEYWSYSNIFSGRNVVFFGDSYIAPDTDNSEREYLPTNLANILNMVKFNFAVPGAGFGRPSNLISSQQVTCTNIMSDEDKENTALVICIAGCNDLLNLSSENITQTMIVDGIINFILWANETFTNARIVVVPFNWGYSKLTYVINYLITNTLNSVHTLMYGKGAIIVPHAWLWNFGVRARFRNPVHPNMLGYRVILNHILNAIMGCESTVYGTGGSVSINDSRINTTSQRFVYNVINGIVHINGFIRPIEAVSGIGTQYIMQNGDEQFTLPVVCTPNNSIWTTPLISSTTGHNVGIMIFNTNGTLTVRFHDVNAGEVCNFNAEFIIEGGIDWQ